MTKVCFVLEGHVGAVLGGAEYQAHLLAEEISSRAGTTVHYLARAIPPPDVAARAPYSIVQIAKKGGILHKRAVFFDARTLCKQLDDIKPDVIYQRMKQSYTGICAWYANRARIPLFFHGAIDFDFELNLRRRSFVNLPFDYVESVAGNWGVKHASHVIVQTQRQRQLLRDNFGRDAYSVVRNFQPLPKELPAKPAGPIRVLWVANLISHKRPELFAELAAKFADRDDVEFIMVGRPSALKSMRSVMNAIKAQPKIQYRGALPLAEVERLMEGAHVFVNTSRFEGFPNTFIQAWARGAVVVSVGVDIDGGMNAQGIGFCTHDIESLRTAVDSLSQSAAQRQEAAAKAFRYVHEHHSLRNAATLADLIVAAARQ